MRELPPLTWRGDLNPRLAWQGGMNPRLARGLCVFEAFAEPRSSLSVELKCFVTLEWALGETGINGKNDVVAPEMQSGSPTLMKAAAAVEKDSSRASPPEVSPPKELACRDPPAGSYQQISCLDSVIRCGPSGLPPHQRCPRSDSRLHEALSNPPQVPGELQRGGHPEEEVRVPCAPRHAPGQ